MINFCWFFFKWGLALVVVAALSGGVYLYVQLDDEIRYHVEELLADHFQDLAVRVGSARLVEGQGIVLCNLVVSDRRSARSSNPLVSIDEIFIHSNVGLAELLQGRLDIQKVIVRRPRFCIACKGGQPWDLDAFLQSSKWGDGPLNLLVEEGQVEIDR
ncbi:MAG: hypothetical protein JW829_18110, partial [Pirellulales bacterium]|nr:hypothetical protein [Pirellulales bacterium]